MPQDDVMRFGDVQIAHRQNAFEFASHFKAHYKCQVIIIIIIICKKDSICE